MMLADLGLVWGRYGIGLGWIRGRPGVDLGRNSSRSKYSVGSFLGWDAAALDHSGTLLGQRRRTDIQLTPGWPQTPLGLSCVLHCEADHQEAEGGEDRRDDHDLALAVHGHRARSRTVQLVAGCVRRGPLPESDARWPT